MSEMVALQPGDTVGRYVIEREIGRGGMGIVYLAKNAKGQRRAIKTLIFGGKLAAQLIERFRREILLLASIEHAHVVRFYEAGKLETPGGTTMWIALEYLEGQTLREIIHYNPEGLDPETVARWCLHIAEGVAAAHKIGVVHRDLKPENAALSGEFVKVYDLGIAKWSGAANPTAENLRIGTLAYMAPEQLDHKIGPIDVRTDVHAIGLILHELATGKNPLCPSDEMLTPQEAQGRVVAYEPPPLAEAKPGFPADLAAIGDRCVKKDQAARYQTVRELADALDDVLARLRAQRHSAALADLGVDSDAAHAARRAKSSSADPTPPPVVTTPHGGFTPNQPQTQRIEAGSEQARAWAAQAKANRAARGEASPHLDRILAGPADPTAPLPVMATASGERIATGTELAEAAPASPAGSDKPTPAPAVTAGATTAPHIASGAAAGGGSFPVRLLLGAVGVSVILGVATVAGYRSLASAPERDDGPVGVGLPGEGDPSTESPDGPLAEPPASAMAVAPDPETGGGAPGETSPEGDEGAAASATTATPPPDPVGRPPSPKWPPPPAPKKPDVVIID
jgi:eukaryotic-like serine/threonine-protein kinase